MNIEISYLRQVDNAIKSNTDINTYTYEHLIFVKEAETTNWNKRKNLQQMMQT